MTHHGDDGPAANAPLQRLLAAGGPMALRQRNALIGELRRMEAREAYERSPRSLGPSPSARLLDGFRMPRLLWARLGIPTALAYLHVAAPPGQVVACYPSPAGPRRRELELGAWQELVEGNPTLAALDPDAEALLVDRTAPDPHGSRAQRPGAAEAGARYAIAPLDICEWLVAQASERGGTFELRAAIDAALAEAPRTSRTSRREEEPP
jgi:hypothetical protein